MVNCNYLPLDQLAATAFNAGAMENWGLVIYREYLLLWNPNLDTPHDKYRVTEVIAHELAHQVRRLVVFSVPRCKQNTSK